MPALVLFLGQSVCVLERTLYGWFTDRSKWEQWGFGVCVYALYVCVSVSGVGDADVCSVYEVPLNARSVLACP